MYWNHEHMDRKGIQNQKRIKSCPSPAFKPVFQEVKERFLHHICHLCSNPWGQESKHNYEQKLDFYLKDSFEKLRKISNLLPQHLARKWQKVKSILETPENENLLKIYSFHIIQDANEFVSSSEQIWKKFALHHLLINVSSAVNGCRQNESPNSW